MLKQNKYVFKNVQEPKWYFMFESTLSFPSKALIIHNNMLIFNCVSHIKDCKDHRYLLKIFGL